MKLYLYDIYVLLLFFSLYICLPRFDMEFEQIDLGFNDDYVDHCDYIDYSELVRESIDSHT